MVRNSMSTVEVMYSPYPTYFPYQRPGPANGHLKPLAVPKMQGCTGETGLYNIGKSESEASTDSEAAEPTHTQYLAPNCLLISYFSGDVSGQVDDHFSRSLSQPNSFSTQHQTHKPWKEMSSMAHRNFPPSFWNSNYQPSQPSSTTTSLSSHGDFTLPMDPYLGMTPIHHHGVTGLQDPWHYPMSNQTHSYTSHTRAVGAELGFSSVMTSSRFNPHYNSLLSTGRLGGVPGQYDLKHQGVDPWTSKFTGHSDHIVSHTTTRMESRTGQGGLDGQGSEVTKDLYWF